jgi:ABC-type dipeptide/oligopeptide/nickel transport system permease component
VQGIVLVIATIFVLINFLTDISFVLFDPRIQHR